MRDESDKRDIARAKEKESLSDKRHRKGEEEIKYSEK